VDRKRVAFVVPGSIDGRTGGYEYDRRVVDGLRSRGWPVDVREIAGAFPRPDASTRRKIRRCLSAIEDGAIVIVDGLAFGAIPEETAAERPRLTFVAIVHLPLAQAVGLTPVDVAEFEDAERRALASASVVVATGPRTCGTLAGAYRVARERIVLAEPGTDPAPPSRGSGEGPCVHILCVGAVTPGKGQETLVSALAGIDRDLWRLTCVGSVERDVAYAARVRALVEARGLTGQVTFAGELNRRDLDDAYDRADVFALATLHETYGMAAAEAIARGLPVIATITGAIPQIVGTAGGRLVAPGDVEALARALNEAIGDPGSRRRLREGALAAARRLPSWDVAIDRIAAALHRIDG
jgi:glycosyltransferase involved in cell wall biosynthesis